MVVAEVSTTTLSAKVRALGTAVIKQGDADPGMRSAQLMCVNQASA